MSKNIFNLENPEVVGQVARALEAACRERIKGEHDAQLVFNEFDGAPPRIRLESTNSSEVSTMLFELLPPVLHKPKELLDYAQLQLEERLEVKEYGADWKQHVKTSKEAAFLAVYLTAYFDNPFFKLSDVVVHTTDECTMYAIFDFGRVTRDDLESAINTLQAAIAPRRGLVAVDGGFTTM